MIALPTMASPTEKTINAPPFVITDLEFTKESNDEQQTKVPYLPKNIPKSKSPASKQISKSLGYHSASWYGKQFHNRKTASGERFNMYDMTAAHKHLKFGTKLKVTCVATGKSVVVKVNDRGPFHGNRALDLSYGAAKVLGIVERGTAQVKIDIIK